MHLNLGEVALVGPSPTKIPSTKIFQFSIPSSRSTEPNVGAVSLVEYEVALCVSHHHNKSQKLLNDLYKSIIADMVQPSRR
mmetsp:Transcript_23857/g.44570  ORF Transcript_23857/g.44570 Transcript_23857/m.44570 type:complete len:81 (-) Transcript_23857:395-637(-)